MAPPGTAPILGPLGANILDDSGRVTDAGRNALVASVIKILTEGNKDGKALLLSKALDLPMPPTAGPTLPAPSLLDPTAEEQLFWFEPEPYAALSLPYLLDRNSLWSKTFVDGLYGAIAKGLNLNGSYAPPLFDPSIFGLDFKFELPDLPQLAIKLPEFILPKLPDLLIKLGIPSLEIPDLPKIPSFEIPEIPQLPTLPDIPLPGIPFPDFAFPNIFIDLFLKLPEIVIPAIPLSIPDLFLKPFNFVFDLFFDLLFDLGLVIVVPKLLVATVLAIMHNVAVMIACDIIGLLLGTGGIVKAVATFGGLAA